MGAHFNNAGSGLMTGATLAAIGAQLAREARLGQVEAGADFDDAGLYAAAARLVNASPHEIAVVESHTRGFSAALGRVVLKPGDRILVTRAEWAGNVVALGELARRSGAKLEIMPVDADGATDVAAISAMIDERVRIVCVTWCPANGGLINPAAELVALGRGVGALTIVDASQALGQMPVDVRALDCDVLTAPGRKFLRAPRGTGLLYVAERALERLAPAIPDNFSASLGDYAWRADARRFENPDMPPSLKAGLSAAIEEVLACDQAAIEAHVRGLAEAVREGLAGIDGATSRDLGRERSCLVSLTVDGMRGAEIRSGLAARGFAVAVNGRAYTPFDMEARGLDEIVRISPHVQNSAGEVSDLLAVLAEVVSQRPLSRSNG